MQLVVGGAALVIHREGFVMKASEVVETSVVVGLMWEVTASGVEEVQTVGGVGKGFNKEEGAAVIVRVQIRM